MPASIEDIVVDSFHCCSELKEINVSAENEVYTSINGVVFRKDLKTLITFPAGYSGEYTIPDGVVTLLQDSFETNEKLTRIIIPQSVTDIRPYVFDGCTTLRYIWYKGTEEQWNNVPKGVDWNKGTPADQVIEFGADAPVHNKVIIPAVEPTSTESGLTEGVICSRCGETITPQVEIPKLSELKVLYLPDSLKIIEQETFANLPCQAVIIPEHCTKITERAFANCKNLIYVKISSADTVIEPDAFEGCEHVFIYHAHEALDEH